MSLGRSNVQDNSPVAYLCDIRQQNSQGWIHTGRLAACSRIGGVRRTCSQQVERAGIHRIVPVINSTLTQRLLQEFSYP